MSSARAAGFLIDTVGLAHTLAVMRSTFLALLFHDDRAAHAPLLRAREALLHTSRRSPGSLAGGGLAASGHGILLPRVSELLAAGDGVRAETPVTRLVW